MTDWITCPTVESVPGRLSGAWVFTGTRIPVSALFGNLAEDPTVHDFVEWLPGVTREQVRTVLEHEVKRLDAKVKVEDPVRPQHDRSTAALLRRPRGGHRRRERYIPIVKR